MAGQTAYLATALDRWSIDLPIAVTMVEDPSPRVRERAVRVLASTIDPAVIPLLKVYLADSDPAVRRQVMLAAGRLGPAGLELAAGGLGDPSPLVRQAAAWAVCHGGDGGWDVLKLLLSTEKDPAVLETALANAWRLEGAPWQSSRHPLRRSLQPLSPAGCRLLAVADRGPRCACRPTQVGGRRRGRDPGNGAAGICPR